MHTPVGAVSRPRTSRSIIQYTTVLAALATLATGTIAHAESQAWQTITPGGDTSCATGTPYNFHVRHAAADRVMIYFNGGGACWSGETCDTTGSYGREPSYRPFATAEAGNDPRALGGAFDLDNPENPFRDWSQVFVSYCTGDVHLGTGESSYQRQDGTNFVIHHRGRINAEAALAYLFANFAQPQRVFVAGGSAGAISSPVLAAIVADHYHEAKVIHFAGGGGGYRLPPPTELWRRWGVFEALPSIFDGKRYTAENTTLIGLYAMAATAYPDIAFHQYDTAYDAVQEQFHALLGYPVELLPGLEANRADLKAALPRFSGYTAAGEFHTLLRYPELYTQRTNGVGAVDWVSAIANGEAVEDVSCGSAKECR
jgi:hypothetical protein